MTPRLEKLLDFLKENPSDEFLIFAIAKEYEKTSAMEEALDYYLKLVKVNAEYVGTYYHLAKLYEKMQLNSKAFDTYRKGLVIAENLGDKHAYNELAGAKLLLGDESDFGL